MWTSSSCLNVGFVWVAKAGSCISVPRNLFFLPLGIPVEGRMFGSTSSFWLLHPGPRGLALAIWLPYCIHTRLCSLMLDQKCVILLPLTGPASLLGPMIGVVRVCQMLHDKSLFHSRVLWSLGEASL